MVSNPVEYPAQLENDSQDVLLQDHLHPLHISRGGHMDANNSSIG